MNINENSYIKDKPLQNKKFPMTRILKLRQKSMLDASDQK
jgi:hypothetical protein